MRSNRPPNGEDTLDAIWDYLNASARMHGHQRTAERFGVSRQTLWRFLDRDQAGRRLPRSVLDSVGGSVEALEAATRRLTAESSPRGRPAPHVALRDTLHDALLHLCEAPLTTASELARLNRIPVSTLRDRLVTLSKQGLVDSRLHRLDALGPRPHRRYLPTAEGIRAVGVDGPRLLPLYPVSKQWFKLLGERLDSVAVLYRVAALVAEVDPERQPVRVDHYRQGPYDALLTLSGGRSVGLLHQGPMLSAANLRFRLRTIERLDWAKTPWLTLVLTDSEQDTRRAVRALADPNQHETAFVACAGDLIAAGPRRPAFQQCGYGFPNTPSIGPDASLPTMLAWITRRVAAYTRNDPSESHPDPDALYRPDIRATMPKPAEQLDAALSVRLTRAEKQALDRLASWPFCTPDQLAGLMGGVTRRRANQVLRSLRRRDLVQREPDGYVLTDEGLTTLARRDRAAVGPTLDRWTPQQSEGVYFGTALRALASQAEHQRGITEFAARLSAEVGRAPDYELLDLLPTQRSQITYWQGDPYVLHPDASFQLSYQGDWDWCLMEYERRAVTPKRVPDRLRGYRRYFQTDYAWRDHGGVEPLVLFLFETAEAERTFIDHAATLRHAPFVSSNLPTLAKEGVLGPSWRLPPPHPAERVPLHGARTAQRHVPTSPSARAQRFL
ncbi:MAG: replication-relaxation family protein [Chloroflexota bacterium]|nr:replication-relaxation family protein [Chloroflexota bacterium]